MNRDEYAEPSAQTLRDNRLPPITAERLAMLADNARQIAEARSWVRQQQATVDARIATLAAIPVLSGNNRENRHE